MSKRARQYIGLIVAVFGYYIIHEGAHLVLALCLGAFDGVNFLGIGVQIDIYRELLSDMQFGFFCLVGSAAALVCAYLLVLFADRICSIDSKIVRACAYYLSIALLFIDPLYLSLLCGFFGGGDMNGISILIPELAARALYGVLLFINAVIFVRVVFPRYTASFR